MSELNHIPLLILETHYLLHLVLFPFCWRERVGRGGKCGCVSAERHLGSMSPREENGGIEGSDKSLRRS